MTMEHNGMATHSPGGVPDRNIANTDADNQDPDKKNVPLELTSYGTTPLGKPRLFVCQVCTRAFARLEHLRRHERSHTKEKPFTCGVCQRKFLRRDLLLRHAQKLHAGCLDAITRLRRKSIKRISAARGSDDDDDDERMDDADDDLSDKGSMYSNYERRSSNPNYMSFNMNNASNLGPNSTNMGGSISSNSSNMSANINPNMNNLGKSLFPKQDMFADGHFRGSFQDPEHIHSLAPRDSTRARRGASFSAQSGTNYAAVGSDYNGVYPNPGNVEFLTPQMMPLMMQEDSSWLMAQIPEMSLDKGRFDFPMPSATISSGELKQAQMNMGYKLENKTSDKSKKNQNAQGFNGQGFNENRQGENSGFGKNTGFGDEHKQGFNDQGFNGLNNNQGFSGPEKSGFHDANFFGKHDQNYFNPSSLSNSSLFSKPELNSGFNKNGFDLLDSFPMQQSPVESYGYSFYDIPEVNEGSGTTKPKLPKSLTPIRQEDEDEVHEQPATITDFDLNFLNDMDQLTHEIDAGSKFVPSGYFFYGDNPLVLLSGMDANSPSLMSPLQPQMGDVMMNVFLQQQRASQSGPSTRGPSSSRLFTSHIRHLIHKSLDKYPISGIMAPLIPSNDKLELYFHTFVQIFLSHFPFIHPLRLSEAEIIRMTQDEDPANESARVCLPLLVATIGALLANNKYDSEHLYEALRRTIHIYLESRKNSVTTGRAEDGKNEKGDKANNVNPLWLIQSLTLLVIYGLFLENENNVYIVIRQLNALNLLVKTSVKSKRELLFLLCGQAEREVRAYRAGEALDPETKFRVHIDIQSQTRIVFMIYRLTNLLLMMYLVPLTLSVHDLDNLSGPDATDEQVWLVQTLLELPQNLMELMRPRTPTITYKSLLLELVKLHPQAALSKDILKTLSQQSSFSFICLVHGLYELLQNKKIDVMPVVDTLTMFMPKVSPPDKAHDVQQMNFGHSQADFGHSYERVDFALLVSFTKISMLVDLNSIKEQSWLRNADQLCAHYGRFVAETLANVSDANYIKIVDCCVLILQMSLFLTEQIEVQETANLGDNNSSIDTSSSQGMFERFLGFRMSNEFDNSTNLIHLQMLFHVFVILLAFSIYVSQKNNRDSTVQDSSSAYLLFELNHRFSVVLKLLDRVENFLKAKFQQQNKLDLFFGNMHLYNGMADTGNNAYTLEKTLYILKVGEVVLSYFFDLNMKVSIFKKLSESLGQIRKHLIDTDGRN